MTEVNLPSFLDSGILWEETLLSIRTADDFESFIFKLLDSDEIDICDFWEIVYGMARDVVELTGDWRIVEKHLEIVSDMLDYLFMLLDKCQNQ